jgi:hypothetical protein
MLKSIYAVSSIALVVGMSMPALAQAQATPPAAKGQKSAGLDPNEVVCQKTEVTGSRLGVKKVCRTRAEWADLQLQDRQEINRSQTQRGNAGCPGC